MKDFIENIIINLIIICIVIIILISVYFCLDVFGIIQVPKEYSLASFFNSKIEVIASGHNLNEDLYPKDNSENDKSPIKRIIEKKNVDDDNEIAVEKSETNSQEVVDPVERLKEIQEKLEKEKIEDKDYTFDDSDANKFYYNQLDKYGKKIYDSLNSNIDNLKTGTYVEDFGETFDDLLHEENGTEILNDSFQYAINALTFDNPDLFYIDVTQMYLLTQITTRAFSKTYSVSIGPNPDGGNYLSEFLEGEDAVNEAISYVEQVKNEIVKQCQGLDEIDKIRVVHDYLVDSVEYDANAGDNIYNIYGTLIDKKAVCEGYARAGKYILDQLNIPCIIACGIGKNSAGNAESHAWNYIKINDKWYALDITWDDPIIIGNGTVTNEIRYDYFLNGSDKFFLDHFEDGNIVGKANFKYPTISKENL